jgi:hypothetical protein
MLRGIRLRLQTESLTQQWCYKMKRILITTLILLSFYNSHAIICYVKPVATGTGSGNTWANAASNIQTMINASASGDQIWVAAGTYKPLA